MIKYIRVFGEFFRVCLVEEFEYRVNFMANLLTTLFWMAISVITVKLYFYNTDQIGGWSYDEVLVLLGVFISIHGFIEFFLQPNMTRFVSHIRKGTFDYILTKPIDAQFHVSFRHLVFWRLFDVALGMGLVYYALWRLDVTLSFGQLYIFVTMFLASLCMMYSLWMGMMILSFWAVKIDNLSFLFHSLFETSRFPVTVYQGVLRFILTYVFPIGLITTFPASSVIGQMTRNEALLSVMMAGICVIMARWFWRYALKHYTSASS
jgi:ABC-2 type transport system permease protein